MKVLDLVCGAGHVFEGWFGSEDDFQTQRAGGLLACPVCASHEVTKRLSAPRLHLRGNAPPAPSARPQAPDVDPTAAPQALVLRALREVFARTEDVGDRFASEARAMHRGDTEERPIRGQATAAQAAALLEEGIGVLPLPDLPLLKGPLH